MSARYIHSSLLALGLMLGGALIGCSEDKPSGGEAPKSAVAQMGRAELWSQTCNRCHNAWSPDQLSPKQWEAVLNHMRVRAGLTGEEQKLILEFLQASH